MLARARHLQVTAAVLAIGLFAGAWAMTMAQHRPSSADLTLAGSGLGAPTTTTPLTPLLRPTKTKVPASVRGDLVFRDRTREGGLAAKHAAGPLTGSDVVTGGVAAGDYDGDGDQDLFVTRVGLPSRLMRNDGTGHFTDVARQAGLQGTDYRSGYATAVWADVTGDGHLDLYLTGAGLTRNALYINDGKGHFSDQSNERGVVNQQVIKDNLGNASFGAAFDDWDHDGDLDLISLQWFTFGASDRFRSAPPQPDRHNLCDRAPAQFPKPHAAPMQGRSRMYRNDGTGHFTDVTAESGIPFDAIVGFQPQFGDVDGDGWDDLFITGDVCTSRVYRNLAGKGWEDITGPAGLGTDENGMGSVLEDLNGDGNLDWFITSIAYLTKDRTCPVKTPTIGCTGNRLFLGDGTGHFTDATDRYGVRDGSWGWGAAGVDLNNDGHTDLVMVNGMHEAGQEWGTGLESDEAIRDLLDDDANRLWLGTSKGRWPEASELVGIRDHTNGKGMVAFDADGDGDLDLVMATTEGHPIFYRNDMPRTGTNHYLTLRLREPTGANRFAIGAEVRVDLGDGSPPRRLAVRASGGFESGDPTDLHVGLGSQTKVARIEVRWPGVATPQVVTDVAADQRLEITKD